MIATTFWFLFYSLLLTLLVTGKICRYKELQDLSPTQIEIEDPQVRQERERIKMSNRFRIIPFNKKLTNSLPKIENLNRTEKEYLT